MRKFRNHDEINDAIDSWHKSPDDGINLPEWLGMTNEEYADFVEHPENLKFETDSL